jgi:multidrug efflux system outer membrane protein
MRSPGRIPIWAAIACALALPGCTVGPAYESPDGLGVPGDFRFSTEGALDTADIEWWKLFRDPVLDDLIDEALSNNLDVRIAAGRVEEFAARIGLTRSAAFPQVGYDGGAGQAQNSRELNPAAQRISSFFEANLNVGWELDVFGRIRRATSAAEADTLQAEEVRRGVILTLVSSVATSYVALRGLDDQLAISHRMLQSRGETVELFEKQYDKGIISQLELAQIRSEYERTAATIPAIERDIAVLENSLSVLLGRPPGEITRGSELKALAMPPIPAGLPSDLLTRRPDLRGAEQAMIAANERVGVAVAEFYPRFNLTGALGLASDDLSDLFKSSAGTYTAAAGIAGPLFTAGFLENQLRGAEAAERRAVDEYRQSVLTALREAEDALVTRTTTIDEAEAQTRQVNELTRYAGYAQQRYDNGYVGFLEVLDAERDLFDAELQQVRLAAARYASVIAIYKAFGGGWVEIAETTADGADAPDATPNATPNATPGSAPAAPEPDAAETVPESDGG